MLKVYANRESIEPWASRSRSLLSALCSLLFALCSLLFRVNPWLIVVLDENVELLDQIVETALQSFYNANLQVLPDIWFDEIVESLYTWYLHNIA